MITNSNNKLKFSEYKSAIDKNKAFTNDIEISTINNIAQDLLTKTTDYTKLIEQLGLSTLDRDVKIFGDFMNLTPLEKMLLLLEIRLEIERRERNGITTPYYRDREFTNMLKKEYGIDIYGSDMMSKIMLLSPKALGIVK